MTSRAGSTESALDARPRVSATIAPLARADEPLSLRESLAWASVTGFRAVQLSASDPATRPRDLGASARRDLRATLTRYELDCSGIDLFIPHAHWTDGRHFERAHDAVIAAIDLASELGRAPVYAPLPSDTPADVVASLASHATTAGVHLLRTTESAAPAAATTNAVLLSAPFAECLDCATALAEGSRPETLVARAGDRLGGVRLVDLLRSGLRGPILEPRESRLDALALKVALEISGFRGFPVLDARQWTAPKEGLEQSLERWSQLGE